MKFLDTLLIAVGSPVQLLRLLPAAITANRTLTVNVNDADRTLNVPLGSTDLPQRHNLLHNGGLWFWTRQAAPGTLTSYSNDVYGPDRWKVLTQTASVQLQQSTGNTGLYDVLLKQNQVAAQRMGLIQFVENRDTFPFRGRTVRFQFNAKCSTTTTLRFAILEWTGTADAVTTNVVLSWTSATFTPGNFFLASNLVVTNATATQSVGTSWQACSMTGTVGSTCNNLAVFVWTDSTAAQNVTVELGEIQLCDDALARDWLPQPLSVEELPCRRFCVGYTTLPLGFALNTTNLYNNGSITFTPAMRATPSLVAGAAFTANAGNNGTPSLSNPSASGTGLSNSGAVWTANALISFTGALTADL